MPSGGTGVPSPEILYCVEYQVRGIWYYYCVRKTEKEAERIRDRHRKARKWYTWRVVPYVRQEDPATDALRKSEKTAEAFHHLAEAWANLITAAEEAGVRLNLRR